MRAGPRSPLRGDFLCSPRTFCAGATLCAKPLPAKKLTVDHVVPVSRGGSNHRDNLRAACKPCNQKRANEDPNVRVTPTMFRRGLVADRADP